MRKNLSLILALSGFLCFVAPAYAQHGLATEFDWQSAWGGLPDEKIAANLHSVKHAINGAVNRCGIGKTNYDLIKVYRGTIADFTAYFLDPSAYFSQGQKAGCDAKPCDGVKGCILSVAGPESQSVITVPCPTGTCQVTSYVFPFPVDRHVVGWSLMSSTDFSNIREARKDSKGGHKYSVPYNASNVLAMQLSTQTTPESCTVDERDINNDGEATADEPCVKYYQYVGGVMTDLYKPEATVDTAENDTRYADKIGSAQWYGNDGNVSNATGYLAYNRFAAATVAGPDVNGQYTTKKSGVDYPYSWREGNTAQHGDKSLGSNRLAMAQTSAYQLAGRFVQNKDESVGYLCDEYTNSGNNDVFVPLASDGEYQSFHDAALAGTVTGVTHKLCTRKYTKWVGQTACPANIACGTTITVTASRRCQRSSSAFGVCTNEENECSGATDAPPYDNRVTPCFFQLTCAGPPCPPPCEGPDCPPPTPDCLAAHAQVLMADGSMKVLEEIKVGDVVMAFSAKAPLAALSPAKVTSVMETTRHHAQLGLYEVNGIPLTSGHRVLSASGKPVSASYLKKGGKLVGLSGDPVLVTEANRAKGKEEKVYSVTLENADGFVVNGVRVLGQ
ncbi:MAG: Hint domain-containing protein [Bdellovibrionales bacterium]